MGYDGASGGKKARNWCGKILGRRGLLQPFKSVNVERISTIGTGG